MEIINGKKYYTREELDDLVYVSIRKNAQELSEEIKRESKFINVNGIVYE